MQNVGSLRRAMLVSDKTTRDIAQGDQFAHAAAILDIPISTIGRTQGAQEEAALYVNLLAFLDARRHAVTELGEVGDLTGFSAILFGDAASKHRRDLAMAA